MKRVTLSDTFTRLNNATAYADGDLVTMHATAGSVVPLSWQVGQGGGHLVRIRIEKSDSDTTNADFTLRLFGASPTPGVGDNVAITHDVSKHIATIDVGAMVAGTDDDYVTMNKGDTNFLEGVYVSESVVYGFLEANAAYTPLAFEVFTVYLTFEK